MEASSKCQAVNGTCPFCESVSVYTEGREQRRFDGDTVLFLRLGRGVAGVKELPAQTMSAENQIQKHHNKLCLVKLVESVDLKR